MIFLGPSDPNFLAPKNLNFGQTSHCAPPTIALFFFYSASSSSLPPKRRWSHYKDCRPAAGPSEKSYKWLGPVTSKINKKNRGKSITMMHNFSTTCILSKKWNVLFYQPKSWLGQCLSPPALYIPTGLLQGKAYSLYFTVVKRRSTSQTFFDFSTLVEWKTFCLFFLDINIEARYSTIFWQFKSREINLVEVCTSLIRTLECRQIF